MYISVAKLLQNRQNGYGYSPKLSCEGHSPSLSCAPVCLHGHKPSIPARTFLRRMQATSQTAGTHRGRGADKTQGGEAAGELTGCALGHFSLSMRKLPVGKRLNVPIYTTLVKSAITISNNAKTHTNNLTGLGADLAAILTLQRQKEQKDPSGTLR